MISISISISTISIYIHIYTYTCTYTLHISRISPYISAVCPYFTSYAYLVPPPPVPRHIVQAQRPTPASLLEDLRISLAGRPNSRRRTIAGHDYPPYLLAQSTITSDQNIRASSSSAHHHLPILWPTSSQLPSDSLLAVRCCCYRFHTYPQSSKVDINRVRPQHQARSSIASPIHQALHQPFPVSKAFVTTTIDSDTRNYFNEQPCS
jgi:hypothetical protein